MEESLALGKFNAVDPDLKDQLKEPFAEIRAGREDLAEKKIVRKLKLGIVLEKRRIDHLLSIK